MDVGAWQVQFMYSSWGRKESDTTERLHFHFLAMLLPNRYGFFLRTVWGICE